MVQVRDSQNWWNCQIKLPNGDKVWVCIELLYGAVIIKSVTPLNPNTSRVVGDHLTGDCLIVMITIITTIIIVSCR